MVCTCGKHECRECRLRAFGQRRRLYHWTPELHEMLRTAYAGKRGQQRAALDKLEQVTGWPRHAMKSEAKRLGIVTFGQRRRWTAEDVAYLEERIGVVSVSSIARNLGRSVESVESRAELLGLSRRVREGYTIADLQIVFGAPYLRVKRWMDRGLFGAVHQAQGCRVSEAGVVRFIREHAGEYDLRRVDQHWFKAMVFAPLADWGERV